jgi:hypothetical protein
MDTTKPAVISSKPALTHLDMVKGQHLQILQGIQDQAIKVAQFNQQKDLADNEKSKIDAEANKENVMNQQKQQELELKKMALLTP